MTEPKKPRTFQLKQDTSRRIDEQCQKYDMWGSNLVDLILQRGLTEMEEGRWKLKRRPIKYKAEW